MNRFAFFRPLPIDENYVLSLVVWLVAGCYLFALIPNVFGVLLAFFAVPLLLQIPMYTTALFLRPDRPHETANSRLLFTLLLLASAYFAMSHSWMRFVAWSFIAVFPLNFVAKLITEPIALLVPNNQWLGPVVSRFDTNDKQVWLTIDDGPTADTHALLDLLETRGVRATFFVKGRLATPELIAAISGRGHTIGNHTQTTRRRRSGAPRVRRRRARSTNAPRRSRRRPSSARRSAIRTGTFTRCWRNGA